MEMPVVKKETNPLVTENKRMKLKIRELEKKLEEIDNKEKALSHDETEYILSRTLSKSAFKSKKVRKFIESFLECENVAQASEMTGIHPSEGKRMRNTSGISKAIRALVKNQAVKHGFDGSEIVKRVKEVVDIDPALVFNADGTVKDSMHDIPAEVRRGIRKFECKNLYQNSEDMNGMKQRIVIGKLVKVEFYDKMKATELIGREKKLFKLTTKVEHDVTKNMESLLLESVSRANKAAIEVIEVRGD